MKRSVFYIVFSLLFVSGLSSQELSLEKARELYFKQAEDSCANRMLVEYLSTEKAEKTPALLAYRGAGLSMMARCTRRNMEKLSVFLEGKKYIEDAVQKDPDNWEIRFLRFSVQSKIPSILRYNDMKEDKALLLEEIPVLLKREQELAMIEKVLLFLLASDKINAQETKEISNLMRILRDVKKT